MIASTPRPAIKSVLDLASASADCFTPGSPFLLTGSGFGNWEDVALDIGVYVHFPNGISLQRIAHYESWCDGEIRGRWPRWLIGPLHLFVETRATCGTIYSAVHHAPLQIAAMADSGPR